MSAKEARGIERKFQAGAARFIRQDFRVGQPGVIVGGPMQIPKPLPPCLRLRALSCPVSRDATSDPL
ncbi:MAG: hypothetical protein WBG11_05930 [Methylocella sp.]